MSDFRTDALRPSGLPSANLGRPRALVAGPSSTAAAAAESGEGSSKNKFWDDWNVRIDGEVKAVAEGLGQLVELSDIGKSATPHTPALISLHLPLRTSQLIKATQQLRDTAHELRLMLLLSDEVDIAIKRDEEARRTRRGIQEARGVVVGSLRGLMGANDERPDGRGTAPVPQTNGDGAEVLSAKEEGTAKGSEAHDNEAGTAPPRPQGDAMELDEDDNDDEEEGDFEEVG